MRYLVLIVDDDQEIRQMLSTLLQINGFAIDEAEDGLEALRKIRQRPPHLVLLDVMMPKMDGVTLCQLLRQDPETRSLPVVMLSGQAHPHAIEEGLRAGANCYLIKPSGLDLLLPTLSDLLEYALAEQGSG